MQKLFFTLSVALLLASHTASAQPITAKITSTTAQPNTAFGLTLGKPLNLPVCEKTNAGDLAGHPGPTCYTIGTTSTPEESIIRIAIPASQKPQYAITNVLVAELDQNQLQAFLVITSPTPSSQKTIINQMTRQFGTPDIAITVTAQDHQKGEFLDLETGSHLVVWRSGDMQILYRGSYIVTASSPIPRGVLHFSLDPTN